MKEIPYLELEKDKVYYLNLNNPPAEYLVEFYSYSLSKIPMFRLDSQVNFKLSSLRSSNYVTEGSLSFETFEKGRAKLYSVTDNELKILKIK